MPKGKGVSASLTNIFKAPLTISLAVGEDSKKQPFRINVGWYRWHPKHFWIAGAAPADDQKLATYRLAPGETVQVVLPDDLLEGDGIFAFWLLGHVGADPKKTFLAQIDSQPFVVDQVRPPRNDAARLRLLVTAKPGMAPAAAALARPGAGQAKSLPTAASSRARVMPTSSGEFSPVSGPRFSEMSLWAASQATKAARSSNRRMTGVDSKNATAPPSFAYP